MSVGPANQKKEPQLDRVFSRVPQPSNGLHSGGSLRALRSSAASLGIRRRGGRRTSDTTTHTRAKEGQERALHVVQGRSRLPWSSSGPEVPKWPPRVLPRCQNDPPVSQPPRWQLRGAKGAGGTGQRPSDIIIDSALVDVKFRFSR